MDLQRADSRDLASLSKFLRDADLTLSGLDSPSLRLWTQRDDSGAIIGSTGYEISGDRRHALIRSVAVSAPHRAAGAGSALARFALDRAAAEGARTAWLFSRRSGPFWQRLGFRPADRTELVGVLASTHQVQLFQQTGQLENEIAWARPLPIDPVTHPDQPWCSG